MQTIKGQMQSPIVLQGKTTPVQTITGKLIKAITKGYYDISAAQDKSLIAKVIEYPSGNVELRISGSGEPITVMSSNNSRPWKVDGYDTKITNVYVEDGVTALPQYAFLSLKNLVSARLPDSLTVIPISLFGNSGLPSITIPETCTEIGRSAFSGTELTEVSIPDSVETIRGGAFKGCYGLKKITFGNGLKTIEDDISGVFQDTGLTGYVELPDYLTTLGAGAFADISTEFHLFIPKSVTSIPKYSASHGNAGYSICDMSTKIHIYCEAESKPSGWPTNWNYLYAHNTKVADTTWGVTREEFRAMAKAAEA